MDISVRQQQDCQVVRLRGALRLGAAVDSLKKLIEEFLANGQNNIVLNLEEMPMMDSSGIGLVVRSLSGVKERGGSIKLVQPSKMVLQTLKLVAVLNLFEIFQNEEDALASF